MILRDTVVEVDLRAIGANMDAICQMVGPDVAVMPVVKANAYGLGAVGVAPTLMEHFPFYKFFCFRMTIINDITCQP